jgi:hypothetical protein
MLVSNNGTELTSNAILPWQQEQAVEWHYIAPGKPMQNGFVEFQCIRLSMALVCFIAELRGPSGTPETPTGGGRGGSFTGFGRHRAAVSLEPGREPLVINRWSRPRRSLQRRA